MNESTWNAHLWAKKFQYYTDVLHFDGEIIRNMRRDVFQNTVYLVKSDGYVSENGKK